LRTACETAVSWPKHLRVADNLSAHHIQHHKIIDTIVGILNDTGLEPHRLEIELTETLLVDQSSDLRDLLLKLKNVGVELAMDDFGTGYSSLSYLMSVPFDKLKIDKSFVDTVPESESGQTIVKMISTLARELKLKVTAEGVENLQQADFLEEVHCDQLQGYYFSKPMRNDELPAYLLQSTKRKLEQSGEPVDPIKSKTA